MSARQPRQPHVRDDDSSTRRLAVVVAYDGYDFEGWQTQPHGRTIQDTIEARLRKIFQVPIPIAGSGRTDSGVHAKGQVFHFDVPESAVPALGFKDTAYTMEQAAAAAESRLTGLSENCGLPPSIQIRSVRAAPAGFHARSSCSGKRYVYSVCEGIGNPFASRYSWAIGRGRELDMDAMREAASLLEGRHDFSGFGVIEASDPRSPVKHMHRLEVTRAHAIGPAGSLKETSESLVTITAECDRFLYHMMRLISGTLVQVGLGKRTVDDVATILARPTSDSTNGRVAAALPSPYKAPARGLCLSRCFYGEGDWPAARARNLQDP